MKIKAGVVLPVFDPQTIGLQVTSKDIDDDEEFDKKATPVDIKVDDKFPLVLPSDYAKVDCK